MSDQSPADNADPRGLETFYGSDNHGEQTSFSCVIDSAGTDWQFPPIPSTKLHKLTRMAHWHTADDFFGGRPPIQLSLWAGDGRLRHSTITGKDLGMSVRHDKQRYERYVVHLDAEGREIAVLSMVLAEPESRSRLRRLVFRQTIFLGDKVRYELTMTNGEVSLAHSKAGRYFRAHGFSPPGAS